MRISDWSSDVCSSDLSGGGRTGSGVGGGGGTDAQAASTPPSRSAPKQPVFQPISAPCEPTVSHETGMEQTAFRPARCRPQISSAGSSPVSTGRSEEHPSDLHPLMSPSYSDF